MPTYFILETSTREGSTTVRDAPRRSQGVVAAAEKMGVRAVEWFYTVRPFDFLMKADAPDDETIAAFAMSINAGVNVSAKSHRAFTRAEWATLVARLS